MIMHDGDRGWGYGGSDLAMGVRDLGAGLLVHEGQCAISCAKFTIIIIT